MPPRESVLIAALGFFAGLLVTRVQPTPPPPQRALKTTAGGDAYAACPNKTAAFADAARADRSLADVADGNSSRLSVALALGSISPRTIHWAASAAGGGAMWLASRAHTPPP